MSWPSTEKRGGEGVTLVAYAAPEWAAAVNLSNSTQFLCSNRPVDPNEANRLDASIRSTVIVQLYANHSKRHTESQPATHQRATQTIVSVSLPALCGTNIERRKKQLMEVMQSELWLMCDACNCAVNGRESTDMRIAEIQIE